jgi:hypothetical protein
MNIDTSCSNRPMEFSTPFDEVCARADRPEIAAPESAHAVFTNGNDPVFSGQVGRKTGQKWPELAGEKMSLSSSWEYCIRLVKRLYRSIFASSDPCLTSTLSTSSVVGQKLGQAPADYA